MNRSHRFSWLFLLVALLVFAFACSGSGPAVTITVQVEATPAADDDDNDNDNDDNDAADDDDDDNDDDNDDTTTDDDASPPDDDDNDDTSPIDDDTSPDDDTVEDQHWRVEDSQTTGQLYAVFGLSPSHVVAVGVGLGSSPHHHPNPPQRVTVENWNGGVWSPTYDDAQYYLQGVWVAPDGSAYAVGRVGVGNQAAGVVLTTTNGSDWNIGYNGSIALYAISGISTTQIWATGDNGMVVAIDNGQWSPWSAPLASGSDMYGMWASSNWSFSVAGFDPQIGLGVIGVYNSTWEDVSARMNSIWGTPDGDLFAVGEVAPETGAASIYRCNYDGYGGWTWSVMENDCPVALSSVSGTAANDVFAVGCDTIMHYDGVAWTRKEIPVNFLACLYGVWADPVSKEAFAVGDAGLILHYTP